MKRMQNRIWAAKVLVWSGALGLLFMPTAWAQQSVEQAPATPPSGLKAMPQAKTTAPPAPALDDAQLQQAREMIGRELYSRRNYPLGQIEDVVRDPNDQQIKAVIAAGGGFLGVGQARILMPLDQIELTSRQQLKQMIREQEAREEGEPPPKPPAQTAQQGEAEPAPEPRKIVAVTKTDMTKEAMQQLAKYTPEGGFEPVPLFEGETETRQATGSAPPPPRG